ncbi:MAG: hypothetical protein IJS61_03815 [Firmicutes bacterium]|nr:hypothetical protein [Bacillota bacterium]
MAKRIKRDIAYYTNIAENIRNIPEEELKKREQDLLIEIGFMAHERLVHLIVTVCFALLQIISVLLLFMCPSPFAIALTLLFFVLLLPYIFHYYRLENGVQKLYEIYDNIRGLNNTDPDNINKINKGRQKNVL